MLNINLYFRTAWLSWEILELPSRYDFAVFSKYNVHSNHLSILLNVDSDSASQKCRCDSTILINSSDIIKRSRIVRVFQFPGSFNSSVSLQRWAGFVLFNFFKMVMLISRQHLNSVHIFYDFHALRRHL